jgi:hypothetical protein
LNRVGLWRQAKPEPPWRSALIITLLAALVILVAWATGSFAQPVSPQQRGLVSNTEVNAVAGNVAVTVVPPSSGQRVHIYSIKAVCTAGTAGSLTITNTTNNRIQWTYPGGLIGTTPTGVAWTPAPFTGDQGATYVINLGTCGGANTGTLSTQTDAY